MIQSILSIFTGLIGKIGGILGIIGTLFGLFWRAKAKRQAETIEQQNQTIKVHEKKEEIHQQDQVIDAGVNTKIDEIRQQVDVSGDQAEAARKLSEGINDYFRGENAPKYRQRGRNEV